MTALSEWLSEGVGHLADARASIFRAGDSIGLVSAAFGEEVKALFESVDDLLRRVERVRERLEEARL